MIRIVSFFMALFCISITSAQTAAEIIEMNLKARGGKEKILSLKNMKMECVSNRQGMEFPLTLTFSHKQGFRMDMQIMGMDCFMLINNKAAYSYFPMRGQASPEAMPDEMHKTMLSRLDLHGDFIDYEAKAISYTVLSEEKIDDQVCYVLLSKSKEGKEKTLYLNKETKLIVKEISKTEVEGEEKEVAATYSDYKIIEGYVLPMAMTSPMQGDLKVTKYVLNSEIKPEIFEVKN
jgi:hypothetical protein